MLVYLDEAYEWRVHEGCMATVQDLREAIMEGAVQRVRSKMMTVAAIMGGLLPIMWTTGTGADVMKRIAAPMIGGMVSSTILTLLMIPVCMRSGIVGLWPSEPRLYSPMPIFLCKSRNASVLPRGKTREAR